VLEPRPEVRGRPDAGRGKRRNFRATWSGTGLLYICSFGVKQEQATGGQIA
jgi:hypothetical protein